MARSVVLALLAARASALCVLRDATVCWGNEHQYVERANFFDGIDVRLAPALADVDGDGDLDLAGQLGRHPLYYENVGSAASPSYEAVTVARTLRRHRRRCLSKPAFADVDGDGDLDLVVGEHDGILFYYENVGSATSPSYEAVTGAANPFDGIDVGWHSAPAFADLDGDGDLDLVVGEQTRVRASPSYEAVTGANPFDGIYVGQYSAPALADLDSDGDLDLVVGEYYGSLYYYGEPYSGGVLNYFEIVGSATSPSYEAVTGAANPSTASTSVSTARPPPTSTATGD
ncbi:calcium ion binding protein [Aureococcus anophagefferens]|nr:calcium ion binding protein [Aureococcus anophagefferens]